LFEFGISRSVEQSQLFVSIIIAHLVPFLLLGILYGLKHCIVILKGDESTYWSGKVLILFRIFDQFINFCISRVKCIEI
jgi:hypothetical protein